MWRMFQFITRPNGEQHALTPFQWEWVLKKHPLPQGWRIKHEYDSAQEADDFHVWSERTDARFRIKTMLGNCGVAEIADLPGIHEEIWGWIEHLCYLCGYSRLMCGTNVEEVRERLVNRGYSIFSEFVNRRTNNRCWLFCKELIE